MKNKSLKYILAYFVILNIILVSSIYVSINVPEEFKEINSGEELYFTFDIKDLEDIEMQDILLEYEIIKGNKTITASSETKSIAIQASFVKSIIIPKEIRSGVYLVVIKVNNKTTASDTFYVKNYNQFIIGIFIILLLIILIKLFDEIYKLKKKIKRIKKQK